MALPQSSERTSSSILLAPVGSGVRALSLYGDSGRSAQEERRRSARVLVVEDNVDAALTLVDLLRIWGHEVEYVHDGPAAVDLAPRYRPEVVLLDIGLPGMDGYEVARRLRQDPLTRGALLVAVTGYGQESDRARSREAGFDHHLVKPVDLAGLRRLIEAPG
jgi:CheY-like chemotaxis protein